MSSSILSVPIESKSAKKRKAKAEAAATASPAGRASPVDSGVNGHSADQAGGTESPYLKEIAKNIRNLHKKLTASAKADHVVEQNPGVSIDDLVAQKKLNADQKAQLLKKPQLQSQLAQLEEQQKHYQVFAQELQDKFEKDKAALVESHEAQLAEAKQEATELVTQSNNDTAEKGLTVITGFLHAAAAKRQSDEQESDEGRAFEGALLLVYQGNTQSLNTLKSLVEGSDDKVIDVEGNALDYTFAQIREVALKDVAALVGEADAAPAAEETAEDVGTTETSETVETADTTTDPTIAHAGLTELEDTTTIPLTSNGDAEPEPETPLPGQVSAGNEAANAVAEAAWDPQSSVTSAQTGTGDDFVIVPRDPAETETGSSAPAVQQSTRNWADETAAEEKAAAENDGFEQVKRERGRGGRGGPRGGGRGYDGRGRGRGGSRGEYRGRGQGRGGRGRGDRAPQAPPTQPSS